MKLKSLQLLLPFVLVGLCFMAKPAHANVLGNPDFEDAIGSGVARNWDSTNGAITFSNPAVVAAGFDAPPQGSFGLALDAGEFTFQTFDDVKPGDTVTFRALAQTDFAPGGGGVGGQIVIEFKSVDETTGADTLISSVGSAFITTDNANVANDVYVPFEVSGVAPGSTERVVFVLRTFGVGAGDIAFDDVDGEVNPAETTLRASKTNVEIGEPFAISAVIRNNAEASLTGTEFRIAIPDGFHVDKESIRSDGQRLNVKEGSIVLSTGDFGANQTIKVGLIAFATSGVVPGETYKFGLEFFDGLAFKGSQFVQVHVTADPLFDQGVIIGRVFNDINQNGIQERCVVVGTSESCTDEEPGIPGVRLVTEEGIVVITDKNGLYHIPGVKQGRHLIKIDGHTLPKGTKFITEENYLVKTTRGILSKANFAVLLPPSKVPEDFRKDIDVSITQGVREISPHLDVQMDKEIVLLGVGELDQEPVFRFNVNYRDYIKRWYIEIRDELGREVWTGFGVGKPPQAVSWQGITESGLLIRPGIYSYQLKVEDPSGLQDWTTLKYFRVVSKKHPKEFLTAPFEIPTVGQFNLFHDGKQTIPLVAKPTLRIKGKTVPGNEVAIDGYVVDVDPESGNFEREIYALDGDKEVWITTTSPDGEITTYKENIKVDENSFFMNALVEQEIGMNFTGGNLETTTHEDEYEDGFYEEGRLSYYAEAKLYGQYRIKSHYDSDERRDGLFTNLDPEDYYPTYGDGSLRDYSASETRDHFYGLLEWNRSYVKWGNFKTEFTDTELASYNRTLAGLDIKFETLRQTPYGDPTQELKLFWTKARHRADHNELASTGGTLYYLRNRNVIEGSEKIRVEIRDKVTNLAIDSYDMIEGADYEVDNEEGRILLTRPLSTVAASDTAFSESLLDGNTVFLIVDYEYDAGFEVPEHSNRGLRGTTYIGSHFRIGATAVDEKRTAEDYQLRGVDFMLKVGRNTKITAEYAETILQQVNQAVSFDGGLSYANLARLRGQNTRERENAYLVRAQSKPIKNLELTGYIQGVEPGFSTDRTRSQEGTKKFGLSALYRISPHGYLRYRYDHSEVADQLLPLEEHGVSAAFDEFESQIFQAVYDNGKWLGQVEYRKQSLELPEGNAAPSLLTETDMEHGVAAKLGLRFNEKLLPYVRAQVGINGKANNQFGGGLRYEITKNVFAYVEQMIGNIGDSTYFGFERQFDDGSRTYANLRMLDRGIGSNTLTTSIGSSFPITKKTRFFSERQYSSYNGQEGSADILGFEGRANESWTFRIKFERNHLDNSTTRILDQQADSALARANSFSILSGAVGYTDGKKLKAQFSLEGRRQQDTPKLWQVASRNAVEYQWSPDLSLKSTFNYGISQFRDPQDRAADFVEFNTGFAYRPLKHDKLNVLGRYTFLRDIANDAQFETGILADTAEVDQLAQILSLDVAYDLHRYLGIVQKVAYKKARLRTSFTDSLTLNSFLWINRFNVHVTRKWDIAMEYRVLWQSSGAKTLKHGALFEVDRELYDYIRIGVGYDFTDFDDNLRKSNSFKSHGPFVRFTGKF